MTYIKDIVSEKEIQFADFVSNAKHFSFYILNMASIILQV